MRKRRLFVGIALEEPVRARLGTLADRLRGSGFRGRFEPREKLHVTVAFLGGVEEARCAEIAGALRQSVGAIEPFALRLDRLGAFPNLRRPRIVWVGTSTRAPAFAALAARVRATYAAIGFRFESDATVHVTICRAPPDPQPPLKLEFPPLDVAVREVTLFESLPAERTTRYVALERVTLASGQPV